MLTFLGIVVGGFFLFAAVVVLPLMLVGLLLKLLLGLLLLPLRLFGGIAVVAATVLVVSLKVVFGLALALLLLVAAPFVLAMLALGGVAWAVRA